jgi:small subunit ribosomal protein S20
MANTSSAKKKVRVIERKTISREMYRNKIKTYIKKVESLITEKDQKSAMELLKKVDPKLQASKNKKIFSKAKISRIQKRLNLRVVQLKTK